MGRFISGMTEFDGEYGGRFVLTGENRRPRNGDYFLRNYVDYRGTSRYVVVEKNDDDYDPPSPILLRIS